MPEPAPAAAVPTWEERINRRMFIVRAGWGIFGAYVAGALGATAKFLFPNVLYEPSTIFKAGKPADYTLNTVSEKWLKDYRTWVIRDDHGLYAIWARCTHLGCTPRWFGNERRFRCPCHGSNYNMKGDVIAGPAPRPLFRCKVSVDQEGNLVVDKSVGAIKSTLVDKVRYAPPYYLRVS